MWRAPRPSPSTKALVASWGFEFYGIQVGAWFMEESGQSLVEYALLLALASVGVVLALLVLQDSLGTAFGKASTRIDAASSTAGFPPGAGSGGGAETSGGAGRGESGARQ
jgi:Flp pilus assembly pilin Flp